MVRRLPARLVRYVARKLWSTRRDASSARIVVPAAADNAGWRRPKHDYMLKESYIHLRSLRFHAFHGVEAQERLTGNDYEVSLRIDVALDKAMLSDDVADTVNYGEAYQLVAQEMAVPSKLVERVAYRIGDRLMRQWPQIRAVDVSLTKLNPPMGADSLGAGVELHLINDKTR